MTIGPAVEHVIVDAALARAAHLHVRRMTRREFDAEAPTDRVVHQTSSIQALLEGAFEGDLTFAELARHGDLGLGTVDHLDGEMVGLDGEFFQLRADGSVHRIDPSVRTPFAVVCRFRPGPPVELSGPLALAALTARLDALAPPEAAILAVRVDGSFTGLRLRSVPRQHRPYPSLAEVVAHQTEWELQAATGTLVGFRFPAEAQGIDVAGYHLHFLSDDRTRGGHLTACVLQHGRARLDASTELHLEVPAGVRVAAADPSAAMSDEITAVEGGRPD